MEPRRNLEIFVDYRFTFEILNLGLQLDTVIILIVNRPWWPSGQERHTISGIFLVSLKGPEFESRLGGTKNVDGLFGV